MTAVLIVEDDARLRRALRVNLEARGYRCAEAGTGEDAIRLANADPPDAVILDLGLPGMSGMEVLTSLRAWSGAPIVILSARDTEPQKIAALDAGADDYVTKPFGIGELLARLRAALRRGNPSSLPQTVATEHFTFDFAAKTARTPSGPVHLTPTEWTIVEHLVANAGRLVTGRQLLQRMWGPAGDSDTAALRVHLTHIRRKLEPEPSRPRYFLTEVGIGYRFATPEVD